MLYNNVVNYSIIGFCWKDIRLFYIYTVLNNIQFRMDLDPFLRNTFWTSSIGLSFTIISHMGIHASSVQRFVALPTFNKARKSLFFFALGMGLSKVLTGMTGLLIYATYKDCDPTLANVSVLLFR